MVKARMRKKVAAANQAATEMDGEDDPGSKEEADAELDATQLWQACCVEQEHLPAVYATYQHWRSLGWIPRPGLQYGVTFLLYRDVVDARQHQHAE